MEQDTSWIWNCVAPKHWLNFNCNILLKGYVYVCVQQSSGPRPVIFPVFQINYFIRTNKFKFSFWGLVQYATIKNVIRINSMVNHCSNRFHKLGTLYSMYDKKFHTLKISQICPKCEVHVSNYLPPHHLT
jgi:hypothetical protein